MFVTMEDANYKLNTSLILYKNHPVKVQGLSGDPANPYMGLVYLSPKRIPGLLPDGGARFADPDVGFRTIGEHLGYLNYTMVLSGRENCWATYVTRIHARHSFIGLRQGNVDIPRLSLPIVSTSPIRLEFSSVISNPGFEKMWFGEYPSFNAALHILSTLPAPSSVAFTKVFAITKNPIGPVYLRYKGSDIGWLEDDTVLIPTSKAYMQEQLYMHKVPFKLKA